jgi:hypothetical protein
MRWAERHPTTWSRLLVVSAPLIRVWVSGSVCRNSASVLQINGWCLFGCMCGWCVRVCVRVCSAARSHSRSHVPLSLVLSFLPSFLLSVLFSFYLYYFLSFPSVNLPTRHSIGEQGCAWRAERLLKTVSGECLMANGLADACQRENRFPFSFATQVMVRAMNSVDPAQGGCPAITGASAGSASSDRVVRESEESTLPAEVLDWLHRNQVYVPPSAASSCS